MKKLKLIFLCIKNKNFKWAWWHLTNQNIFEKTIEEIKKRNEVF